MKKIFTIILVIVCFMSLFMFSLQTVNAATISSDSYSKTGKVYTIDGEKYYETKTTKDFNGVSSGSEFYLNASNQVVKDAATLDKIYNMKVFNQTSNNIKEIAKGNIEYSSLAYDIFTQICVNEKIGDLVGKTSGSLLTMLTPGASFKIADAAISIAGEVLSPSNIKSVVLAQMLRFYANNVYSCGSELISLISSGVTDYNTFKRCALLYAECVANNACVKFLAHDQIEELANSSTANELKKYFKNVFLGFADSIVPDIAAAQITKYISDGIVTLAEFALSCGSQTEYDNNYNSHINVYNKTFPSVVELAQKLDTGSTNSGSSNTTTGSYTTPPTINENQVLQKINKLVELLDKKHFTTTQKSCGNNSCSSCYNVNVFASTWFKNMFGTVSANQIPGHAYPNGSTGTPKGWSCHGFVNFAMWYIFASSNTDKVGYNRIVDNVKFTKANMEKYAKPGDVIRYSNHSVVLISINESNITVLDCNAQLSGDGYSKVRKHTITFSGKSGYTMAISRAKNYDTSVQTNKNTLSIQYNVNGGTIASPTAVGSVYKITVAEGINVRTSADSNSTKLTALKKGTSVTVYEQKTIGDYVWGKIKYQNSDAWIALSYKNESWVTKTSTVYSHDYYVENNIIYKKSTSLALVQTCVYGETIENGLYNDTTFNLSKEGYKFIGWSTTLDGNNIIDQDVSFKPESLVSGLEDNNQSITVYAIWEKEATNDQFPQQPQEPETPSTPDDNNQNPDEEKGCSLFGTNKINVIYVFTTIICSVLFIFRRKH